MVTMVNKLYELLSIKLSNLLLNKSLLAKQLENLWLS